MGKKTRERESKKKNINQSVMNRSAEEEEKNTRRMDERSTDLEEMAFCCSVITVIEKLTQKWRAKEN